MMALGVLGSLLTMVPLLLVIGGGQLALMYVFVSLIRVTMSATWAPLATVMAQMYRPQARYTSMSLAHGIGAAVWGALPPIAAVWLLSTTGTVWSVVILAAGMAIINAVALALAPQHIDAEATPSIPHAEVTTELRPAPPLTH